MLLTKYINIKMNRGNLGYYNKVMLSKFKVGDVIEIPIDKIPKSMYVDVNVSCDICSTENIITYRNYNDCLSYGFYTCLKCKHVKRKMTNLKKYGTEDYVNVDKRRETLYNQYGFYNNGREKSSNTCMIKYGVDNVSKLKDVKDKKAETSIKNWGVTNPSFIQSDTFISKTDGYLNYNINDKLHNILCKGHTYSIDTNLFYSRFYRGVNTCTICNPLNSINSSYECLIIDIIKENYNGEVIKSYRDKYEIDIYLPELKLGIEVNGLYWHSTKFKSKNYHLDKTKFFHRKGIRIFHIWEDDIIFRREIVVSTILNLLNKSYKIFARKCESVYITDKNIIKNFLNNNHIQGYNNNIKKTIGLLYNNEIVSMMCFNDLEGRKRISESYNITRFCNKINTSVIGGASKILKRFISDNNDIDSIISYAEYSQSNGDLYKSLGFSEVDRTYPDYKYIIGNKRIHKSNFKKEKLGIKGLEITEKEFTESQGIYRIYDCGKIKFKLTIQ